ILPIAADVRGYPSFIGFLARVRDACVAAYAHQDVPFERIVQAVRPSRTAGEMPLVHVLFSWERDPATRAWIGDLEVSDLEFFFGGGAVVDLGIACFERPSNVLVRIGYRPDLYEPAT